MEKIEQSLVIMDRRRVDGSVNMCMSGIKIQAMGMGWVDYMLTCRGSSESYQIARCGARRKRG